MFQGLANPVHAYVTYSKLKILQIAVLDYFSTSTLKNTFLQLPWYVKQLSEIRCTCTFMQSVCQIPKTNNMACFSFHVLCLSSYNFKSYYSL